MLLAVNIIISAEIYLIYKHNFLTLKCLIAGGRNKWGLEALEKISDEGRNKQGVEKCLEI